jgi:hypothetical protein
MQPGSPEHVNIRLDSAQWISTDADRVYFAKLVGDISSCERPGEKLNVAPIEEPYAWRRNYALLEALKLRDRQTRTKAGADLQLASLAAEMNRSWTDYNTNITWLREFEGRNRGEWKLLTEWVGLTEDDLGDPVPRAGSEHAQYGRHPDWWERAGRVSEATHKLRGLTPEQRAEVPRIVEGRRRLAVLKGHDTDIANLFDVVRQLAQRLEALESRLPSQKEVTSAMVA